LRRVVGSGEGEWVFGEFEGVQVDDGVVELSWVATDIPESSMGWYDI
jgi:hypothetical protein